MASAVDVALRNMTLSGADEAAPQGRPPYVRFETRSVEDRNATIDAGHYVGRDVLFALVTARGSKDVHEKEATEWLASMEQEVREGRFPLAWLRQFHEQFELVKKGLEAPLDGHSLKEWPPIRAAQLRTANAINLFTVEDLANCNEESVQALGMGGRALRDAAANWLKASKDIGPTVLKLQAAEADVAALKERNASLEGQMKGALARLDAMEKGGSNPAPVAASAASELFDPPTGPARVRPI